MDDEMVTTPNSDVAYSKQYYPWLDWAKVVGIFLVIYDHGGQSGDLLPYIKSFLMPMFFIVSGILYRPLSLKETLQKDLHTLVIPYLLLNLICWLPSVVLYLLRGTFSFSFAWSCIGGTLLGLGYNTAGFTPISTPCWFIYTLFLARLVLSLLPEKNLRNMTIVSVASIAGTLLLHHFEIDLLVPLDSALIALPFMCLGYLSRTIIIRLIEKNDITIISSILLLVAVWYIATINNGSVDLNTCNTGYNIALYYVAAICGSLVFFKLNFAASKLLKPFTGGVKNLSKCTLIIVALNLSVISLCHKYLLWPLHIDTAGGIGGFFAAVVEFIIFIPICLALKRWFPVLIGKRN